MARGGASYNWLTIYTRASRGLTLIELLVVLAILATLSTVALRSTSTLVDQSRFEVTRKTLENIENAIVGRPGHSRDADDSLVVSGFVADMGRLPKARSSTADEQLVELWRNPGTMLPYAIQSAPGDPDVSMGAGWRGPYLKLPIGADSLTDGWGFPFELRDLDRGSINVGDEIAIVRSLGADNLPGGESYNTDLGIGFVEVGVPPRHTAILHGNVRFYDRDADRLGNPRIEFGTHIVVRVYGPTRNGAVETLAEFVHAMDVDLLEEPVFYRFDTDNLTLGPRVIRAYQTTELPDELNDRVEIIPELNALSEPMRLWHVGHPRDLIIRVKLGER